MSVTPGSVAVTIEADESGATTGIGNVSRSLLLLGVNINRIASALGIQNEALNAVTTALITAARAYLVLITMKQMFNVVSDVTRVKNYATATSFAVLRAAMGDYTALAVLGIAMGGAAVGGYALGGGFSPKTQGGGGSMQPVEAGSNVQVFIQDANFTGPRESVETVRNMGNIMASEFK